METVSNVKKQSTFFVKKSTFIEPKSTFRNKK